MNSLAIAGVVAVVTFAGGGVGLWLQGRLPETYTSDRSRDAIGAVVGLVTLLEALVLGLLIWSAYGVYTAQKLGVQTFAAQVRQFDLALADYGREARPVRVALWAETVQTLQQFWGYEDDKFVARNYAAAIANIEEIKRLLGDLHPATDQQKQALSAAQQFASTIGQTRLLLPFQLDEPVSWPLLIVVVSWSFILFCGFGLLSRAGAMSLAAFAFGALAVASAVYLIVDLSEPYSGYFRVSRASLERVIADLNK